MQVNITFRHLDPTEALKAHVRDRVERVQKYIDRPTEAYAVLHLENLKHHAELTVKAGRFLLRGTAKTGDMYASIDAAADKIERQLKKHKEKLQNHKAAPAAPEQPPVDVRHDVLGILEDPSRPSHKVIKSTEFQAKPMSLDEAILQLDLLDAHFYVFQNAEDRSINVVYRRDDGNVGLIEAHPA
ncbi:sigma 54 modulation protein/ribosomal protein S30EA [Anaeromyxobacter sp. K]|uniref:ribosome hibernation-promoting factor, HPF/YfiA family n=1 Tax=Anaeromyxobacter sp. (strain K) TaxID=447217 RepID=UPI00015F9464|nr:ribosome-associated translation inhibitor RaiA [Anaeromyxobacter sp. K]ACG75500.1 sigma 54 modulation protein/ribosomal protein S30EA [Anaeromyxobacter sp. K]